MEAAKRKLDIKIGNIVDPETNSIFAELSQIVGVKWDNHLSETLFQFLQLCHHPGGGQSKFCRIKLKDVVSFEFHEKFVLRNTVGECGDFFYGVCKELVPRALHIEIFSKDKICVFLGKMFDPKCGKDRGRYSF